MNHVTFNQIETDFIEFLSQRDNRPYQEIEDIFIETKNRFRFDTTDYRKLTEEIHDLHSILLNPTDEISLIESYRQHSLIHLFRYISYSYTGFANYVAAAKFILHHFTHNFTGKPVVVEYGCGQAFFSFEIAKLRPESKVYLIDIPCISFEFVEYRFKKHGIDTEIIPITETNLYPKLPRHNICIANEVMEHLVDPLRAYRNICDAMDCGGILYGNFNDHEAELFHVSTDLSRLREEVRANYHPIETVCFKKVK